MVAQQIGLPLADLRTEDQRAVRIYPPDVEGCDEDRQAHPERDHDEDDPDNAPDQATAIWAAGAGLHGLAVGFAVLVAVLVGRTQILPLVVHGVYGSHWVSHQPWGSTEPLAASNESC